MKLLVLGHNDWWVWARQDFCTRNGALVRALARRPEVERIVVVDSPRYRTRSHRPEERRGEEVTEVAPRIVALRHAYPVPAPARSREGWRLNDALTRRRLVDACRRALAGGDGEGGDEAGDETVGNGPGGTDDVVVWVADPRLAWAGIACAGGDLLVFDAIDDWRFHPWAGHRLVDEGYHAIADAADIVTAVTPTLLETLAPRGRRHSLFNAIDPAARAGVRADPGPLAGLPRPVVGYVGTLQARIDPGLVVGLAREMPEATFVLAGPAFRGFGLDPGSMPLNVRLLGPVPHPRVPGLLTAFDACFMPHLTGGLATTMDPLKLYEYLAAGRPVVSTLAPPNPILTPHVRVAADPAAMAAALREELAGDDAARREARRAAVGTETWEARAAEVVGLLQEGLTAKRDTPPAGART